MFITLEGPDGSGKTSQAHRLVAWLRQQGYDVVQTREPGGTDIGCQIRRVLHDTANTAMAAQAEILLYSADRAQHVAERIRPALAAGKIVISDRYYDSTLAYQGYGRQLDIDALRAITDFATGGLKPDLTIYLDLLPEQGLQRRKENEEEWNRLDAEALDFHRRVRAGYLALIDQEPQRWITIDASRSIEIVHEDIRQHVTRRLNAKP